ncbi:hypothetical protein EX30DRAFT_351477 [Ascodesmis nigricans]|uniref:Uncharacterized protein n=1 Tax=Ascodesmis nigricans TaxID=341454 RepID=A0A4S2MLQ9_9PEZI|nr:hypothetical protein EX30DRAFT_351477 [Ascodesmis nigricans]
MADIDIESYISPANLLDVPNLADVNVNALDSLPVTPNIFDLFPDAAFTLPDTTPSPPTDIFLFNSPQDEEQCIHSPLSPGLDFSFHPSAEHDLSDLSELPTGDISLSPALEPANNLTPQALDLDALLIPFTPTATTPPPNIKLESPAPAPAPAPMSSPTPHPLISASPEMSTPRYVPPLTLPEEPIQSIKVEYSIPKLGDFTTPPLPSPVVEPSMPASVISTPALNVDTTTPLDPAGIGDVSLTSSTTTTSTASSTATPSTPSQSSKPKLPSSSNKNRTRFTPGTVPSGNTHASRYLGYVTKYRELPLSRKSTDQEHVLGRAAQPRLCFFCRYLRKLGAGEEKEGKGKRGRGEAREEAEGVERARSRASSSGSESSGEAHEEETATKHVAGPIRHHHYNHHRRSPGASGVHGEDNNSGGGDNNNGNATAKEILEKARLHPQGPREGHVRRTTFECRASLVGLGWVEVGEMVCRWFLPVWVKSAWVDAVEGRFPVWCELDSVSFGGWDQRTEVRALGYDAAHRMVLS